MGSYMPSFDSRPLAKQIDVRIRPRPIQVAYLIELCEHSHTALDDIFAECYGRWGGVNTPIVPIVDGAILPEHLQLLALFDPDVIGWYGKISDSLISQVDRATSPYRVVRFEPKERGGRFEWHGRLGLSAVGSLSVLPYLRNRSGRPTPDRSFRLLDAYPGYQAPRFITDNFGLIRCSTSAFPPNQSVLDLADLLLLTSEARPEERKHFLPIGEDVFGLMPLLAEMGRSRNVRTLAQLSGQLASKPIGIEDHSKSSAMTLVIGDSPLDRILFWNSRLFYPDWRSSSLTSMSMTTTQILDIEFMAGFTSFLKSTNWITPPNHGGIGYLNVVSHSLSEAEVKVAADQLGERKAGWVWSNEKVSLAGLCPKVPSESYRSSWTDATSHHVSQSKFRVSAPTPPHLEEGQDFPALLHGSWASEVLIERDVDNRYVNVNDVWILPRRVGVAESFCTKDTRVGRSGHLVTLSSTQERFVEYSIPNDRELAWTLLAPVGRYESEDPRKTRFEPSRIDAVSDSEEAKYLNGMIGLFGSQQDAIHWFENRFWRRTFSTLAEPARSRASDQIQARLSKEFRNSSAISTRNLDDISKLERVIKSMARELRVPQGTTDFGRLLGDFRRELDEAIEHWPHLGPVTAETERDLSRRLERSAQHLCALGVFDQGIGWVCRHCGNRNWRQIDELKKINTCSVCRSETPMPIEKSWQFRMSDFLSTSLREHGTLALLLTLGALRKHVRHSLLWWAPQSLYEQGNSDRFAEIDLLAVVDGEVFIGEVKRSVNFLRDADLEKLAGIVTRVRADGALISCLDAPEADMQQKAQKLRSIFGTYPAEILILSPRNSTGAPSHYP